MVVKKKSVSGFTSPRQRQFTKADLAWLIAKLDDGALRQNYDLEWKSGHVAPPGDDFADLEQIEEFDDLELVSLSSDYAYEDYVSLRLTGASPLILYKGYTGQDKARQVERWWQTSPGHARVGEEGSFASRMAISVALVLLAVNGPLYAGARSWAIAGAILCVGAAIGVAVFGGRFFTASRARRNPFVTERATGWWRNRELVATSLIGLLGAFAMIAQAVIAAVK